MTVGSRRSAAISPERTRAELGRGLEERQKEIEEQVLTRACAVAPPEEVGDAEYLSGLLATVATAIEYGLSAIAVGEERAGPVPQTLLDQARLAVRNRVRLETVLRRYFAGYTVIGDFLMREASLAGADVDSRVQHEVQRELASLFDRTVAAVSTEYERAAAEAARRRETRVAERVKRLIAGDLVDTSALNYEFDGWHIGMILTGASGESCARELARGLGCWLLLAEGSEATVWAWLGGRCPFDLELLDELLSAAMPEDGLVALGEPSAGMAGWRLTHRQAQSALTVGLQQQARLVRYADIAITASLLKDDVLIDFLSRNYLQNLAAEPDRGEVMLETLRAYFSVGGNVSSAAALLGVTRQTVTSRIHSIEARLGRSVVDCAAELEAVLKLELLGQLDRVGS